MTRAIFTRVPAYAMAHTAVISLGLMLAAGGLARAQDLPDATRATSREITMYIPADGAAASAGVSREVTMYIPAEGNQATLGISREVSVFVPPGALETLATSREVTARFNYSLRDVQNALRISAGLQPAPAASSWDFSWLNAAKSAPSASVVDVLDAAVIAREASHP